MSAEEVAAGGSAVTLFLIGVAALFVYSMIRGAQRRQEEAEEKEQYVAAAIHGTEKMSIGCLGVIGIIVLLLILLGGSLPR